MPTLTPNDKAGLAELFRLAAKNKHVVPGLVSVVLSPADCNALASLIAQSST